MLSKSEEDYIKAIFQLAYTIGGEKIGTNQLAQQLDVAPASANNMLKRLKEKNLVDYQKYGKLTLTPTGKTVAIQLIRKHRLWETFLYQKLGFSWDEVHDAAEQLEHVQSEKLIERLDQFLGNPQFDPHGDPIPDAQGNFTPVNFKTLAEVKPGEHCRIIGVKDSSSVFLQYLTELGLALQSEIQVLHKIPFDNSLRITIPNHPPFTVSEKFALHILVEPQS
jgi:DtxR family Mn-dependent transcriptional regulator